MRTKIIFYRQKCIACNYCVENAIHFWKINEKDGKPDLLDAAEHKDFFYLVYYETDFEMLNNIIKNCSPKAIRIETLKTKNLPK